MATLCLHLFSTICYTVCTCDRGEEDAHQQREGGCDVSKNIGMMS